MKQGFVCFPPNQLVLCNPEIKPISDITIGERVLTDEGTFEKVEKTYKNWFDGDLIKVRTQKFNLDIKATPEHPILIANPKIIFPHERHWNTEWTKKEDQKLILNKIYGREMNFNIDKTRESCIRRHQRIKNRIKILYNYSWKAIKEIKNGDFLTYPIYKNIEMEKIDKNCCIFCHSKKIKLRGFTTKHKRRFQCKTCGKSFSKRYLTINNIYDYYNTDLCYLFGIFFADGNANPAAGKVRFAVGKKYVNKIAKKIENVFGITPKIYKRKNFYSVEMHSTKLSRIFNNYGKGKEKHPPIEILNLPNKYTKKFLEGYVDGDGCIRRHLPKKYKIVEISTVSPSNLFILTQILLKHDIIPSISKIKCKESRIGKQIIKQSEQFRITYSFKHNLKGIIHENKLLLPIKKIEKEKYTGYVHNLEVKNNHTYTLPNSIVHNCMDELWLIADARTSRATKNRIVANILAKSRKRDLTIAYTSQVISAIDNRIRKITDFLAYAILSPNEDIAKVIIFRGGKASHASWMKDIYFRTELVMQMYSTNEEIEMEEQSDTPMQFCFQESKDSPPQYFKTWEAADKAGEKWWVSNFKTLKGKI
jgi:transposase-like protein